MLGLVPKLDQCLQENLGMAIEFLSEDEIYEAVYGVYSTKLAKIKEAEYWDKVYAEKKIVELTASQVLNRVLEDARRSNPKFELTESDVEIYRLLSLYFSNDKSFESEKESFSMKKGILLFGNIGCGKTTTINLFRKNQNLSFHVSACMDISSEFSKGGQEAIDKYSYDITVSNKQKYFGQDSIGRCFDDLGTERLGMNFGDKNNVMAEILMSRYRMCHSFHDGNFTNTHLTTNCTPDEIKELYGDRVFSRITEMFNIITYPKTAQDKRK